MLLSKNLRLISEKFNKIPLITTFQSRFGPQEWLQPYTDKTFEKLPSEGKKYSCNLSWFFLQIVWKL